MLNMDVTPGRAPPGAPVCELIKGGREAPPAAEREGEGDEPKVASALLKKPFGKACDKDFDWGGSNGVTVSESGSLAGVL